MLLINETGLLEALKEKIEAVNKGEITFNRTLADAVVQPSALPKDQLVQSGRMTILN